MAERSLSSKEGFNGVGAPPNIVDAPRVVGKLLLKGHFFNFLLLTIGIVLISILGGATNFFEPFLGPFGEAVLAFLYGVLVVPAFAYITFRWFFLRTEVVLNALSADASEEKGTLALKKGFGNFLVAYFLAFGVLIVTLGIGFPYYFYEQKAWFFRQSLITFPNGKVAHSVLIPNFKTYFFKSWGFVIFSLVLLFVLPLLALFFLLGDAIFGGIGFILISIGVALLVTNYYFYWSTKWMLNHTQLVFSEPVDSAKPHVTPEPPTKQLYFKSDFFDFTVWSVFFLFLGLVTLGIGFIVYAYWIGQWFVNSTEIRERRELQA